MAVTAIDRGTFRWRGWPWVLLTVGLLASAQTWLHQSAIETQRHNRDLQASADAITQDLLQRLKRCDRLLDAAAVWASGAERQDRQVWASMAARLNVGQGDWCTDALTWYPRVTRAERDGVVAQLKSDYGPSIDIRPPGDRPEYFPLTLAVPEGPLSRRFLGIDPWANPKRRADLQRAAEQDRLAASAMQRFTADEYALLRYVPVRTGDGRLLGFVGAPLRLERLVEQLHAAHPTLRVSLGALDDEGRLQRVGAPAQAGPSLDPDLAPAGRRVESGGQVIEIGIEALRSFHTLTAGGTSIIWLPAAVAVLTLMASLLVHVVQRSDGRARRLAEALSAEALSQRRDALRAEAQRSLLVELVPIGVMHIGPDHCVINANKAAHEMLGYPDGELQGLHVSRLHDAAEVQRRCDELSRRLGRPVLPGLELFEARKTPDGAPVETEWTIVRRDGSSFPSVLSSSPMHTPEGQLLGSVRVFTDISERKLAQEQMRFLALHDGLTGLANRVQLEQVAQQWLATERRADVALLLMDLNRFKQINDSLGHPVGDEVLRQIGRRLQDTVRPTDLVARMGGDEFVVLLQGVGDAQAAQAAASRLRSVFDFDLDVAETRLRMSGSIGVALHPQHGRDLPGLLKAADLAMYRAKREARAEAVIYDPLQDSPDASRLRLERDLRVALGAGQFEVHYQPLVCARTAQPVAVEALVRWRHPSFGMVAPSDFIPVAESTGDIVALGAWVLETACHDIQGLRQQWPELQLAVNLSVRQLEAPDFDRRVAAVLAASGLPPQALELEITEGLLAAAQGQVPAALDALHRSGVRIAIDDFGTGYSALQYLKHFPIRTLKIDRSFVRDLHEGATDPDHPQLPLASAIVALAHSLSLHTVAEGVETEAQQRLLAAAGCDWLQGYRFGHPVPLDRLAVTLQRLQEQPQTAG